MRLVHRVEPLPPDAAGLAWWVELRARVGPFTRSKQLRMVRTEFDDELVRFERVQADDRDHAAWILIGEVAAVDGGAELTMHLEYTGDLWSRSVLGRILDDEVRRSTAALARLLTASSPRAEAPVAAPLAAGARSRRRRSSVSAVSTSPSASVGDDRSAAHQHGVGERRRHVLDVVGDDDERRRVVVGGEVVEGVDELLPAGEVEPGRRLVEQHDGRVVHQRPGEQDASLARPTTASPSV